MEEERERAETGLDPWVDYVELLGEKTPEEILLDDTVPVLQERPRLMIKLKMTQEKKKDTKEGHTKEQKAEKTAQRGKCVPKGTSRLRCKVELQPTQ